jgi:nitroreductase
MSIIKPATDISYPRMAQANEANCMKCGHCESFCSQGALVLDERPEEKSVISDCKIDALTLGLYIKKRRSIRHYSNKPVPKEIISELLDVAHYAPTAGNSQTVQWLVIYKTEEVKHIAELVVEWMRSIQGTPHPLANYVPSVIAAWDKGLDPICRNAPHLVFAHIPVSPFIDDRTDAIIALSYLDIAAPAFGLGTCWAGFIRMAIDSYKPLQDALGLPGRKIGYAMMLGYPTFKPLNIPRRNPIEVSWR